MQTTTGARVSSPASCHGAVRRRGTAIGRAGRWLLLCSLAAVPAVSQATGSAAEPGEAFVRRYLVPGVKVSASDLRKLATGACVTKSIDSDVDQETASLHIVRVAAPADWVASVYLRPEVSAETADALGVGMLSGSGVAELDGLSVDRSDVKELKKCRPGSCKVKLPLAWMNAFRRRVDWSSPEAPAQASALYRELLGKYIEAYRQRGDGALAVYRDKKRPVAEAEQISGILEQSPYLCAQFPEVCRALRQPPGDDPGPVASTLFWMKDNAGTRRNVTSLVHEVSYAPADGPGLVMVSKQLYANHYFEASLGITRIVPIPESNATLLVYIHRARIDALRGWGLFHGRIHRGVRNKIGERIEQTKQRLEALYREARAREPAEQPESQYRTNIRGLDRRNMDPSVDACTDFYRFANGAWLDRNPVPADRSRWSSGSELQERNFALLKRILEQAAAATSAPRGSVTQRVGDFYAAAMDTDRIERDRAAPIAGDLASIDAIDSVAGLQRALIGFHAQGLPFLFGFAVLNDLADSSVNLAYVVQGGLGLPEKDYYLREDDKSAAIRTAYVRHVARMFELLGDAPDQAQQQAARVMDLETELARVSLGAVQLRNPANFYAPMSPEDAEAITPSWSWSAYFAGIGIPDLQRFSFPHKKFFARVNEMLTQRPLADWKAYLRWHLVNAAAPYLSSEFEAEDFAFFQTTLSGTQQMQPRWKRALRATDAALGEDLGQLYVAEAFPPQAKQRALDMVHHLTEALRERLMGLDWMSEQTKHKALAKLATFRPKIGYPDHWRDYSGLQIERTSYFTNVRAGIAFEARRTRAKIGQPPDRDEWNMSPPTVNAYYNPLQNEIVFPAGIMQPPFFDASVDDAVNYGAMGAVIGHEIMHGFDDQGSRFDADGNFANWWTEQDRAEFNERAEVLVQQFNDYVAVDDLHVNGQLTLGENIGDLGGLIIAYYGLQKALQGKPREPIDGFTPEQRFFLAFAQAWRANQRDASARLQVQTNPHSPARFRAIGPLANMPEFAAAFGCKPGDPMVRSDPVRIW